MADVLSVQDECRIFKPVEIAIRRVLREKEEKQRG
jgi:hypothetical protein